ncbi:hypothetical protein EC973_006595 [Apophysomyces ossiformis]|uniref:DUF962-domain-containing protein n=1 Tax=Apophysomyces ossiformis TaxID=679940 RepID=A0A8H7BR15_9FUNG|nr:hypothetical protein EC973_006595 [Apophysomyces ossiformis]
MADIFDLKKQLVFYGAHHNNKVNIAIHMVFVPIILWTFFGARTGPLLDVAQFPESFGWLKAFGPNLSFFVIVFYSSYYAILDPVAGALCAPLLYGAAYTANQYYLNNPDAIKNAAVLHVIAWIIQFVGHGFAEKRSPKLMDNLVQALVSAPYFVFFEILFALGYRPQLHKEMMVEVNKDIAAFRAKKLATKAK